MDKIIKELTKIVVSAILISIIVINFVFEIVSIDGRSMLPTINNKDRVIVEKVSYYFKNPKKNEIVIIKYPADTRERFIKRVAAVAGDKVKIEDNKLYINDKEIYEPYIYENTMMDFEEKIVPDNSIFVLGDNRNHSKDSRTSDVGFINLKLLVGRVIYRIYPFNMKGKVR